MKTNRPQLVISFAALAGSVRSLVSAHIQRELFKLGYVWSSACWNGQPQETHQPYLFICSPEWSPTHITYCNGPLVIDPEDTCNTVTKVFDANDASAFLEAARVGLREERVISGVNVVITPSGVELNPTKLLADVTKQANAIRQELWSG